MMHGANMKIKHTINELNDFIACDIQSSHAMTGVYCSVGFGCCVVQ